MEDKTFPQISSFNDVFDVLYKNRNAENAVKMRAYMRNQFEFLGIPTPKRRQLCKPFIAEAKKSGCIDFDFVKKCWDNEYRELQYLAVDYLVTMKKHLTEEHIDFLKELTVTKSWWDTVDGLDELFGDIALKYPNVNKILLDWSIDDNIWLRRTAIDHQLLRKDKTDTELLGKIIKNNFGTSEFFINKAIGWSLREYSKTNPLWVRSFIESNRDKMSPLSVKEGSKYI